VARFEGSGHKRAVGRIAVQSSAIVYPLQGDLLEDPFSVMLDDISTETVGFTAFRALMPFSSLVISMPTPGDAPGKTLEIRCRVVRCSRLPHGRYRVGAQFLSNYTRLNRAGRSPAR
jgi:hypothetical protein